MVSKAVCSSQPISSLLHSSVSQCHIPLLHISLSAVISLFFPQRNQLCSILLYFFIPLLDTLLYLVHLGDNSCFQDPVQMHLTKGNSHLILYDQFIAMLRWLNLSCKLPRFPEPYVIDWLVCLLCIPLFLLIVFIIIAPTYLISLQLLLSYFFVA